MQNRIIKTIIINPRFAEMDVEYYGNHGKEILKQCLVCEGYHLILLGACPKTGKIIANVARLQAEEEEKAREAEKRKEKADQAWVEYRCNHTLGWRNNWRDHIKGGGGLVIYILLSVILFFVTGFKGNLSFSVLIPLVVTVAWISFWGWRHRKYKALVYQQADDLHQRILMGEIVDERRA